MEAHAESITDTMTAFAAGRLATGYDLEEAAISASEADAKIGLLATVNPEGLPHITLITSMQARGARELMFGQFTEGVSKKHVKENPRAGFLVMSSAQEVWRGKARWKNEVKSGSDYELYNHKPMFRYNAYFGVHTVHYLDVVEVDDKQHVSVPRLVAGAAATAVAKPLANISEGRAARRDERILSAWAEAHVSRIKTLKFLAYVGDDGYPELLPPVACRAIDSRRLLFSPSGQSRALRGLSAGGTVALFALSLDMESVLVRGRFTGYRSYGGMRVGGIEVDWVYNSMPPKQGQIYPPVPLRAVTTFD